MSHTVTSCDSNGFSFSPRPRHESHTAEENSATSHAASGRGKSARSSCLGTGYTSRGGASGARRRRNHATTPTATRITAAITSRAVIVHSSRGGEVGNGRADRRTGRAEQREPHDDRVLGGDHERPTGTAAECHLQHGGLARR